MTTASAAWHMLDRRHLVLAAILVAGAVARFSSLEGGWFLQDQVRDALAARGIVSGQEFPLVGPHSALSTVRLVGPLYYYLIAIPYALSPDPAVAVAFMNVLGVLSVYLTYRLGATMLGPVEGLVAAALYAVFPTAVLGGKTLWNPGFTPFFSTLFLLSFLSFLTARRPWALPLSLFLLGVLLQIHMSGAIFVLIVPVALALYRPPIRRWPLATGLGAVALLYAPYVVFQVQQGFADVRNLFAWVGGHREASFWAIAARGVWTPFLHPERLPGVLDRGVLASIFPLIQRVELALFALGVVALAVRSIAARDRRPYILLGLWLALPLVVVPLNRTVMWYYFDILYPAQFLVVGLLFQLALTVLPEAGSRRVATTAGRIAAVSLIGAIVAVQLWFTLRWDRHVRHTGLLRAPRSTIVLSDSEPRGGQIIIDTLPLRDKKALARSFQRDFGVGHALAERHAHGATYELLREDKGVLFEVAGRGAAAPPADPTLHYIVVPAGGRRSVEAVRHSRVGPYAIVAYRPAVDYTSWKWSPGSPPGWWSESVDDSAWAPIALPVRQRPDPTVYAEIPSTHWPASAITFRGRMTHGARRDPAWLVVHVRGSQSSRHPVERVYLNGRPLKPAAMFSRTSANFPDFHVLFDLTDALRPGSSLIAFEIVGTNSDFDVDVYELRAADPKIFGQSLQYDGGG